MSQVIIPFGTILLCCIMLVLLSCSSRNQAAIDDKKEITASVKVSDTVPEIGKSIRNILKDSKGNDLLPVGMQYNYHRKQLIILP